MKGAFDEEQDDTKKQITDLQYDLLELRDAHAKLRTTNEKLRRDKEKFERERDEYRYMVIMLVWVVELSSGGYKTLSLSGYKKRTGQFLRALHIYSIDNFVAF